MKNILFLVFCLLAPLFVCAQNNAKAVELLEKSAAVFRKDSGMEATFLLKDGTSDPKRIHSFEGTLRCRNSKFVIQTPDMKTWFDGKTQWSYVKSNQEVNITNPNEEEIAAVNPVNLLTLYKHGYRAVYKGERHIKGKQIAEIELVAEKKDYNLRKIFIRIDTATLLPVSVQIHDNNGRTSDIDFLKITQNNNYKDEEFVFNKQAYPEAEIIDLR